MVELTTINALILSAGAIVAGFILLIRGGNWTIDSAVFTARRFGISPMVVGFTIVAFGTSLPEMVVSVNANFQGSAGIALGNVLGSNIANILFVLGITAVFVPLATKVKIVAKDIGMMLLATFILLGLLLSGSIGFIAGVLMIVLLALYVFLQYILTLKGIRPAPAEDEEEVTFSNAFAPYFFLLAGLVSIALGAEFMVRGSKIMASVIGVPEAVIALSIIAFGTSLPELSTCIIAGRKGHTDIVIGNIVGSNVFNILMILGVTAILKPILPGTYAAQLIDFDIWVVVAVSLLLATLLLLGRKIGRVLGIGFLLLYLTYNIYIYAIYITP